MPKNDPCIVSAGGVMLMTITQCRDSEKRAVESAGTSKAFSWAGIPDPDTQEATFMGAVLAAKNGQTSNHATASASTSPK